MHLVEVQQCQAQRHQGDWDEEQRRDKAHETTDKPFPSIVGMNWTEEDGHHHNTCQGIRPDVGESNEVSDSGETFRFTGAPA